LDRFFYANIVYAVPKRKIMHYTLALEVGSASTVEVINVAARTLSRSLELFIRIK